MLWRKKRIQEAVNKVYQEADHYQRDRRVLVVKDRRRKSEEQEVGQARGVSQINKVSTLLTGETLLKTQLISSVALENCREARAKRFRIRAILTILYVDVISPGCEERLHGGDRIGESHYLYKSHC
ncbi:hypothetical protein E2C01_068511 [Portunus trituberculatus]|uniref:Uncharacterized protein n=1 Tax=Portunus trituberculatus TaxID=210409 RepID=A0A5B7HMK8_PORTR|nr:hypothetical protein [Portunus trituberculatus]